MRFLATLLLTALAASAQTNILKVSFADLGLEVRANRKIELRGVQTNLSAPYIISREYKSALTDTNGVCRFTNVVAGAYDLSLASTPPTIVRIGVTNSGTNVMEAYGLVNVASDGNAVQGYTQAAADARFYLRSNPSNYVTASITNGLGGGGGTTYTNANIRVGLISGSSIGTNTSLLLSTNEFYSASNSMVSAWTASDAVVSNKLSLVPQIQIVRGTNRVDVADWDALTNLWQAGDIVELGRTNYLDRNIEVNKAGITIRGRGVNASWIGTVTNRFEIRANDLTFQDFTMRAVLPHDVVYGNIDYPAIGYFGKENVTNVTIQNLRMVGPYSAVTFTGTNLSAFQGFVTNAVIRDSEFVGFGSWNGANIKFDRWDTNSSALVQRCTLTHTSLGESTNVQAYGSLNIRAQYGNITVQDSFLRSVGYQNVTNIYGELYMREQIGIYLQNAVLTVEGCKFVFEGQGPQPAGAIFREGGTLTLRRGGISSEDIHNNGTTYGGYTASGGDITKVGTGEIAIVGTNGVSVQQYSFRDMPWHSLAWDETAARSEYYPQFAAFYGKSNTFGGLSYQTNSSINLTNDRYVLSFWATNGVVVTNLGGTNYIAVLAANDALVVSNIGSATMGGIAIGGFPFDTNYANPGVGGLYYTVPDYAFDYTAGGTTATNIRHQSKALYSPSNFAWVKVEKITGTRKPGVWRVETFETANTRKLRIELGLTNLPASQLTGTVPNAALSGVSITNLDAIGTLESDPITVWPNGFQVTNTGSGLYAPITIGAENESVIWVNKIMNGAGDTIPRVNLAHSAIEGFLTNQSTLFIGGGSGLTNLNASQLTTGTVPAGRLTTAGTNLVGAVLTSDGVGGRYWTNVITGFSSVTATNIAVSGGMTNVGVFYQTNGTGWVSLTNGTIRASAFSATRFLVSDNTGLVGMAVGATASSALASGLSDETGTGAVVFNVSPTLNGLTVTNNATISGNIAATNGFVDIPRSSAPTFVQIGSRTNTPVMWWSNSAPCVRYVTYYDASSNAVTTNLFSLP